VNNVAICLEELQAEWVTLRAALEDTRGAWAGVQRVDFEQQVTEPLATIVEATLRALEALSETPT